MNKQISDLIDSLSTGPDILKPTFQVMEDGVQVHTFYTISKGRELHDGAIYDTPTTSHSSVVSYDNIYEEAKRHYDIFIGMVHDMFDHIKFENPEETRFELPNLSRLLRINIWGIFVSILSGDLDFLIPEDFDKDNFGDIYIGFMIRFNFEGPDIEDFFDTKTETFKDFFGANYMSLIMLPPKKGEDNTLVEISQDHWPHIWELIATVPVPDFLLKEES